MAAAVANRSVPELTRSASIKLNARVSLPRHLDLVVISDRTISRVRVDHGEAVDRRYSDRRLRFKICLAC